MRNKQKCPTEAVSGVGLRIERPGVRDFSFHCKFFYFSLLFLLIRICLCISVSVQRTEIILDI